MANKSFLEKWKDWRLWAHYVALAAILLAAAHLLGQHWIHEEPVRIIGLIVVIALGDQAIHWLFHTFLGWED